MDYYKIKRLKIIIFLNTNKHQRILLKDVVYMFNITFNFAVFPKWEGIYIVYFMIYLEKIIR